MKKFIFAAIAFVFFVQAELFAQIVGSPHDFSGTTDNHNDGEICKACHTPHNAGSTEAPLWRGSLGTGGWSGTHVTYNLYSSDTLDATVNQPLTPSKACLTCHDGSIAIGPTSGYVNECVRCHKNFTNSGKNTDLTNDHPISLTFDAALAQADVGLRDPSGTPVPSLGGKTIRQSMLYQDRLECTSCHDVHATKGDSKIAPKLLLVNNSSSALCLTCHNK